MSRLKTSSTLLTYLLTWQSGSWLAWADDTVAHYANTVQHTDIPLPQSAILGLHPIACKLLPISRPDEARRLSWPEHTVGQQLAHGCLQMTGWDWNWQHESYESDILPQDDLHLQIQTRMVQLPATAAIEYVAACCRIRTGTRTRTKIGTRTKTVRGVYARSPQVQCVYAPSRLSVPSIVAWRTNKKTKRQTRPRSSVGSTPPLPKFSGYVEVEAHYIFHPSTIWVRPLFTELGPKKPQKSRFRHEANEYMSP